MNIFISQPFSGYTINQIEEIKKLVIEQIKEKEYTIVDNFIRNDYDKNPLTGLGDSIKCLSNADKVYIAIVNNKPMSKGCKIEFEVCKTYGIPYEFIVINYNK